MESPKGLAMEGSSVIKELCTFLLAAFGLVWVFLALMRNLLLEWKFKGLDKKKRAV